MADFQRDTQINVDDNIPGVDGGLEKKRLRDPRFRLKKRFSTADRVKAGILAAGSALIDTMSNFVPALAAGIIALSIAGIALSSVIIGVAVVGLLAVGLIWGVMKYKATGETFRTLNQHMDLTAEKAKEVARLKEDFGTELRKQGKYVKEAERLGIDIKDLIAQQEVVVEDKKQKTIFERLKSILKNFKSKFGKVEPYIDNGISILAAIGISTGAVLAVFISIAAIMGHNIMVVGLLGAVVAVTGLTGPLGVALMGAMIVGLCAVLLSYKFFWEVPLKRTETYMKEDRLQHELGHEDAHKKLQDMQKTNNELLLRINHAVVGGFDSESDVRLLEAPDATPSQPPIASSETTHLRNLRGGELRPPSYQSSDTQSENENEDVNTSESEYRSPRSPHG